METVKQIFSRYIKYEIFFTSPCRMQVVFHHESDSMAVGGVIHE